MLFGLNDLKLFGAAPRLNLIDEILTFFDKCNEKLKEAPINDFGKPWV